MSPAICPPEPPDAAAALKQPADTHRGADRHLESKGCLVTLPQLPANVAFFEIETVNTLSSTRHLAQG